MAETKSREGAGAAVITPQLAETHRGDIVDVTAALVLGYIEGKSAGVQLAAEWLLARAAREFQLGNDREAMLLRKLSDELPATLRPRLADELEDRRKRFPIVIAKAERKEPTDG